jgi:hypothetical protein
VWRRKQILSVWGSLRCRASIFQVVFTLSPSRVRYLLLIVPPEHGGICVSTVSITGMTVLYSLISASLIASRPIPEEH